MDNKCVYLHKTNDDIVFYVGSGTIDRAYLKSNLKFNRGRGATYANYVEKINFEYTVEIIADHLSQKEALELEVALYFKFKDTLVNKNKPSGFQDMSFELMDEWFCLDELSPSGLRWKKDATTGTDGRRKLKVAGDVAGYINDSGYWVVGLLGNRYRVHRIVATLHGLDVNGMEVDHLNNDRSNNKISNLNVCSHASNALNLKKSSRNKSDIVGVHFCCIRNRWIAQWIENGKSECRRFPIDKFGFVVAHSMAVTQRLLADERTGSKTNSKGKQWH